MTGGRIWFAVSTGRISTEKFREVDKKSFFEFREVETASFLLFASGIAPFFLWRYISFRREKSERQ